MPRPFVVLPRELLLGAAFAFAMAIPLRVPVELRNRSAVPVEVMLPDGQRARLEVGGATEVRVKRWADTAITWRAAGGGSETTVVLEWRRVFRLRRGWMGVGG